MSRRGAVVASVASFGAALVLSQLRYHDERRFPPQFGEAASEEQGHEVARDQVEEFFEGRELAGRLTWLFYALGLLFAGRAVFK